MIHPMRWQLIAPNRIEQVQAEGVLAAAEISLVLQYALLEREYNRLRLEHFSQPGFVLSSSRPLRRLEFDPAEVEYSGRMFYRFLFDGSPKEVPQAFALLLAVANSLSHEALCPDYQVYADLLAQRPDLTWFNMHPDHQPASRG